MIPERPWPWNIPPHADTQDQIEKDVLDEEDEEWIDFDDEEDEEWIDFDDEEELDINESKT